MDYVMLAMDHNGEDPTGWLMSEKLDGQRAWWDGGISRGAPKAGVPWANRLKDSRYKVAPVCTGLWSRYGNIIHAPDWFLDQLPKGVCLDGELYIGRGCFQETRSVVSTLVPGVGWSKVKFKIIDAPDPVQLFCRRTVRVPGNGKVFIQGDERCAGLIKGSLIPEYENTNVEAITQQLCRGQDHLDEYTAEIVGGGGEGVILRLGVWVPYRSKRLLKVKPTIDGEGTVVGWVPGKGKYVGKLGALKIKLDSGIICDLSGMSDLERDEYKTIFPIGCKVHWVAMGYTNTGSLREGRYVGKSSSCD